MGASELIALLGLEPHPEGGFYRQTFADEPDGTGRPHATMIYFMLTNGKTSTWHRVDSAEGWHWYAGSPLLLRYSRDGKSVKELRLGNDFAKGERPQAMVPRSAWQQAQTAGDWSLVGCSVAPGFMFSKFELAPKGWQPGG